ncbi:unnamed protein product, partial [Musa banksii]
RVSFVGWRRLVDGALGAARDHRVHRISYIHSKCFTWCRHHRVSFHNGSSEFFPCFPSQEQAKMIRRKDF